MANIVIASPVLSDAGAVTAGNALGTLPVVNLQDIQLTKLWRTSDHTNTFIEIDLATAQAITVVALLGTNASTAATWRIRAATTQANLTAAPGFDTTAVTAWPETGLGDWSKVHLVKWVDPAETFRWWRIDIADSGNADGYVEAGRVYIAAAWQPAKNLQFGHGLGWIDSGDRAESDGGQIFTEDKPRRRLVSFDLDFLTENDMLDNAFDLDRLRGAAKDVLVITDPASASHLHKRTVYGLMTGLRPIINRHVGLYQKSFRIEELI